MQTWQDSGLLGLGVLDQGRIDNSLASRDFTEMPDGLRNDVEALLTGGFPLIYALDENIRFEEVRFQAAQLELTLLFRYIYFLGEWRILISGN